MSCTSVKYGKFLINIKAYGEHLTIAARWFSGADRLSQDGTEIFVLCENEVFIDF